MLNHNNYAALRTSAIPDYLEELTEETFSYVPVPNMLSGKVNGRLLSMLSKLHRPKLVVELGTYTGYSALCLAEGLAEGGMLHTIEHHERLIPIAQRYFDKSGLAERITLHHGEIMDVLPTIPGPVDLLFLDCDKPNYDVYLESIYDRLASGALVIADNVFWSGKVLEPQTNDNAQTRGMIRYTEKLADDERFESVYLPMNDGFMLSRKK